MNRFIWSRIAYKYIEEITVETSQPINASPIKYHIEGILESRPYSLYNAVFLEYLSVFLHFFHLAVLKRLS